MTDIYVMPEDEFEETEDAVLQTPRGRAFLRMYAKRQRAIAVDDMQTTVEAIKNVSAHDNAESAHLDILRQELQEMSAAIVHCRSEIAAIKPEDGGNNRIMAATEELDAIVSSTERATTDILSAAEVIQDVSDKLAEGGASSDLCDQLQNQSINIMTACSFQDLTGQRTTKVVNALRYLEQRVNAMIDIWAAKNAKGEVNETPPDIEDDRPDSHLLNGPQPEGQGVSQGDVDAMFDEPTAADSEASNPPPPADAAEEAEVEVKADAEATETTDGADDNPADTSDAEKPGVPDADATTAAVGADSDPADSSDTEEPRVAQADANVDDSAVELIDIADDDAGDEIAAVAAQAASADPVEPETAAEDTPAPDADVALSEDADPSADGAANETAAADEDLPVTEAPLKEDEVAELLGT